LDRLEIPRLQARGAGERRRVVEAQQGFTQLLQVHGPDARLAGDDLVFPGHRRGYVALVGVAQVVDLGAQLIDVGLADGRLLRLERVVFPLRGAGRAGGQARQQTQGADE
jgi:hypothetical protein